MPSYVWYRPRIARILQHRHNYLTVVRIIRYIACFLLRSKFCHLRIVVLCNPNSLANYGAGSWVVENYSTNLNGAVADLAAVYF